MRSPRCASKTTDKLVAVLDFLAKSEFKSALLTWDRIEDPEEGTVIVPILDIKREEET